MNPQKLLDSDRFAFGFICFSGAAADNLKLAIQSDVQVTLDHACLFYCHCRDSGFIFTTFSSAGRYRCLFFFNCLYPHTQIPEGLLSGALSLGHCGNCV